MKPYYFPPDVRDFYPSRAVAKVLGFKMKSSGRNLMLARLRSKGVLDSGNIPMPKYRTLFRVAESGYGYAAVSTTYFSRAAVELAHKLCLDMLGSGKFDPKYERLPESDDYCDDYRYNPYLRETGPQYIVPEKEPRINLLDFCSAPPDRDITI